MFFKKDDEKKEQLWKSKYYDTLEKLDKKEKEWTRLESAMRSAMSRLSLAIDGVDSDLDKQLDMLRRSIRRGVEGDKLAGLIQRIIETLDKIETEGRGKKISVPAFLEDVLNRVNLPKSVARKEKSLRSEMARYGDRYDATPLIASFAELLLESLSTSQAPLPEESRRKEAIKEEVGAQEKSRETPVAARQVDLADTTDLSGRHVLEQFLNRLLLPDDLAASLTQVRSRLGKASLEQELERLAIELAEIINHMIPGKQADTVSTGESGEPPVARLTINAVLLQLLSRIDLPEDAGAEVEAIRSRLEGTVEENEWPDLLERISQLISSMRENVAREKRSIEEFLAQLTQRLQELDTYIDDVEKDHRESIEYGRNLGEKVRDQVQGMQNSIRQVSELEQLKEIVITRLDAIAAHMENFARHEEERDERAERKIEELNERIRQMETESEGLRNKVRKEREQALIDPLTEINNRMAYDERVAQEHARWKRYHAPLSLLVIDIDFFKKVNDTYGHIAGDKVLHTIAQLIRKNIRETDFLARYGGEEFVIVMPDTGAQEGLGVAEKLRAEVEACGFHFRGNAVPITISCGVAEFIGTDEPATVFERADKALYKAKGEGRNRCITG